MIFLDTLKRFDRTRRNLVIPDIKLFSPKEGDLLGGRDPVSLARELLRAGAPVLSVVTEPKEFHGSMELLRDICQAVNVPVLRKDFIETRGDLEETVNAGAKAILLMYSTLGRDKLHELYGKTVSLGLTPFVETHTEQELKWAAELGAELVGINNRDILKLERDDGNIEHTKSLVSLAPKDSFVISESSIRNGDEVRQAVKSGVNGVLVGTTILRASDPAEMYRSLSSKVGMKICGLTDSEGIALCGKYAVDMLGFVVDYPVDVPWNLSTESAKPLIDEAKRFGETVVVTGGSAEKVFSLADTLRPDYIQLHYKESFEEMNNIAAELKNRGIKVIRSIPSTTEGRAEMFGTSDLTEIVERINTSEIHAVLFDSRDAENASVGGNGIDGAFGGDMAEAIRRSAKPVLLGGGITYKNAENIINKYNPDYIDVMSGVEVRSGSKSAEKLQKLCKGVRRSINE